MINVTFLDSSFVRRIMIPRNSVSCLLQLLEPSSVVMYAFIVGFKEMSLIIITVDFKQEVPKASWLENLPRQGNEELVENQSCAVLLSSHC